MDHKRSSNALAQQAREEPDTTDYEQRHFANLCATAFLLALAICIGATIKIFDHHQKIENCLLTGRNNCVEITQGAPRGIIVLRPRP